MCLRANGGQHGQGPGRVAWGAAVCVPLPVSSGVGACGGARCRGTGHHRGMPRLCGQGECARAQAHAVL